MSTFPPSFAAPSDRYIQIYFYLCRHITSKLSISKICKDNLISRSQLEKLFHENYGAGVMDCFFTLKAEAAIWLIRTQRFSLKQIASLLGYSSVQYFSRQFKKQTKMTPSECARSMREHPKTPSSYP